jgi:hypothetical protein
MHKNWFDCITNLVMTSFHKSMICHFNLERLCCSHLVLNVYTLRKFRLKANNTKLRLKLKNLKVLNPAFIFGNVPAYHKKSTWTLQMIFVVKNIRTFQMIMDQKSSHKLLCVGFLRDGVCVYSVFFLKKWVFF